MDLLHTNTIERIDREIPGVARPGEFLLCMPRISLLAVVDLEAGRVGWSWGPGELDGPHEPTVVSGGHILVFDNGRRRGWSRLLEIDPRHEEIVWEYRGDPVESFFTISQGGNQKLPNGNLLVTESTRGRVFEITQDGRVVWEFYNPQFSQIDGTLKRGVI